MTEVLTTLRSGNSVGGLDHQRKFPFSEVCKAVRMGILLYLSVSAMILTGIDASPVVPIKQPHDKPQSASICNAL